MGGLASVLIIRSQLDSDCLEARVKATAPYRVSIGIAGATVSLMIRNPKKSGVPR